MQAFLSVKGPSGKADMFPTWISLACTVERAQYGDVLLIPEIFALVAGSSVLDMSEVALAVFLTRRCALSFGSVDELCTDEARLKRVAVGLDADDSGARLATVSVGRVWSKPDNESCRKTYEARECRRVGEAPRKPLR